VIGPNGNVHAGGSRGAAVTGPNGTAVAGSHGAFTAGSNGFSAHGSRGGVATGTQGTVAAWSHGGVAAGPYGAVAGGSHFVAGRGEYGAGFAGTRFVGASDLRGQGTYIRNNFNNYNSFNRGWYTNHPGAWLAAGWAAGAAWNAIPWGGWSSYYGYPADTAGVYYDYGDNVTYQDGQVYYGDQAYVTQDEYAQQADDLAQRGRDAQSAPDENWQPLGVFAMAKGDESNSADIFQLALNKEGVLRGNYYNAVSDTTQKVAGSLDKKTQRVAWCIADNPHTVFEAGLYNLTMDQTTMLVHYGKTRTEQFRLFRVQQPNNDSNSADPATNTGG